MLWPTTVIAGRCTCKGDSRRDERNSFPVFYFLSIHNLHFNSAGTCRCALVSTMNRKEKRALPAASHRWLAMRPKLKKTLSWLVAALGSFLGLIALSAFGMSWLALGDHDRGGSCAGWASSA